ncbi:MAG: hypothetical protein ACYC66_10240 [Chloroflexota bacterium]
MTGRGIVVALAAVLGVLGATIALMRRGSVMEALSPGGGSVEQWLGQMGSKVDRVSSSIDAMHRDIVKQLEDIRSQVGAVGEREKVTAGRAATGARPKAPRRTRAAKAEGKPAGTEGAGGGPGETSKGA